MSSEKWNPLLNWPGRPKKEKPGGEAYSPVSRLTSVPSVRHRWQLPADNRSAAEHLSRELRIGMPAALVLVHRGFGDPASARRFLVPALDDLHDPLLLRGMPEAVARLGEAIRAAEKILIYGDYDVDGTTSVVLLTKAIELAGGKADYHVPHRLKDGYGMRSEVVEAAAAAGVEADDQRGHRHSRGGSGAPRQRVGNRRHRHRSPLARSRAAARAGGAQSQPAGLPVSGEEPVRRGRGVQTGAGAVRHAGVAGRESRGA